MKINFKSILKYTGFTLLGAAIVTTIYQLAKDTPLPEGVEEVINEITGTK